MPRPSVFALILIIPAILIGCSSRVPPPSKPDFIAPFTDVTAVAGIRFEHENGRGRWKLLPETMCGGVVVFDYNVDGHPDILFVNGGTWTEQSRSQPSLFKNNGNGTFTDVSKDSGFSPLHFGMGGCAADVDNDGFPDLFLCGVGGNRIFHNVGGHKFEDVTERSGLSNSSWPSSVDIEKWNRPVSFPSSTTWLDYDGDARLDLFVCNYVAWSPANDLAIRAVLPGGVRAYVPPTQFPGTQCQLFRNLGDGRFREVTFEAGIEVSEPTGMNGGLQAVGKALGVAACDPDRDGWPDLLVANDTVRNFFFHNIPDGKGGRRFEEIGLAVNAAYSDGRPRGGMGIDSTYLEGGQFAAAIANFSNEPNTVLSLVRSRPLLFQDIAAASGMTAPSRGPMKFGAFFFDPDLDGRPDLLTVNGHLEPDIGLARPGQAQAESPQLFHGLAGGNFELVRDLGDLGQPKIARGSAYLDFDGDGDQDVIVVTNGGPAKLFRNDIRAGNNWVRLKLIGDGIKSNRDAIGATIDATVGGVLHRFGVTGSRGYLSQSELTVTIGLGRETRLETVTVNWPGRDAGSRTWSQLEAGKLHRLEQ